MSVHAGERVLVTGATGFIGANLVRRLLLGDAEVHALVRRPDVSERLADVVERLTLHVGDLTEPGSVAAAVSAARPAVVFHLAGPHGHPSDGGERWSAAAVSVFGTLALLEAAATAGVRRFVHGGSSLEYAHDDRPLTEAQPLQPVCFRGAAKAAATVFATQLAVELGVPLVNLRLFSVYGPWEAAHRLVPTAVRAALLGEPIRLTVPGLRHDLVYVGDVVDALLAAVDAECPAGDVINVGTGRQWTNEEVVALVGARSDREIAVTGEPFPARRHDTTSWVADIGKAAEVLHWTPRHSLAEGIDATIAWWRPRLLAGA